MWDDAGNEESLGLMEPLFEAPNHKIFQETVLQLKEEDINILENSVENKADIPLDVVIKEETKRDSEHFSEGSVKSDLTEKVCPVGKKRKKYEQVLVKGYTLDTYKEEPILDISKMFKDNFINFEKQQFHQQIFDKFVEDMDAAELKVTDLENHYLKHIRRAAKLEVYNCSICEYQTIKKSNIKLHLFLIHKIEINSNTFKCLKCSYTCKNVKGIKKHVLTHDKEENQKSVLNNKNKDDSDIEMFSFKDIEDSYFSNDNDEDFIPEKSSRRTFPNKQSISYTDLNNETADDFSTSDDEPLQKRINQNKKKNNSAARKKYNVNKIHKCSKCDFFEGVKKSELTKHIQTYHPEDLKVLSCDFCEYETGDKDDFNEHKQSHRCADNMRKFQCYKCEMQYLDKWKLKKHLLKVHEIKTKDIDSIKIYKCNVCEYETDLPKSLQIHELSHKNPDEIEWFQCAQCEFRTKFKKSYTEHLFRHKKPEEIVKSFMCEMCSYSCRTKGALKKHLLTHKTVEDANITWYKCPECDHKTKFRNHLKVHLAVHKDPSEIKMYICEICGMQSKRKWNYEMHLLTHKDNEEVEIFKCAACNYKTKFKDRLKRHLKKGHHGNRGREGKLQRCSICNFECNNRKVFCRHVMSHKEGIDSTDGAYTCDVCGFKTMYKSSFDKHKTTHKSLDEVETFRCPECDYRTRFKGNLKHHVNTHKDPSEIPMFKCDICGIQFRRKENLSVHSLLHKSPDEVPIIKCTLCSYHTKFRAYMVTHLKKTHKIITRKSEFKDYATIIDPMTSNAPIQQ